MVVICLFVFKMAEGYVDINLPAIKTAVTVFICT